MTHFPNSLSQGVRHTLGPTGGQGHVTRPEVIRADPPLTPTKDAGRKESLQGVGKEWER